MGGCELGTGAAEVSQGLDRQPRVANHRHQTEGGVVCGVCICVFVFAKGGQPCAPEQTVCGLVYFCICIC